MNGVESRVKRIEAEERDRKVITENEQLESTK